MDNIKSRKKTELHPLYQKQIRKKTEGRVRLNALPPSRLMVNESLLLYHETGQTVYQELNHM